MGKYEQVIRRLEKENRVYSIKVLGDKKNKENAFGILLHTRFTGTAEDEFHGIKKKYIDLLTEAEIKFKILR